MPAPTSVTASITMTTVQVTFDPATSSLTTNVPSTGLAVPPGISMVVLQLSTVGGGPQAVFQSLPIQWFESEDSATPTRQADIFLVQRVDDTQCTIVVFNSASVITLHRFNIVVAFEGNTFGSDPVIINEPPATGTI